MTSLTSSTARCQSTFFFTTTATTDFYTLSLHDALPISLVVETSELEGEPRKLVSNSQLNIFVTDKDRKSTRLNSSRVAISYAVFCLKKKKKQAHSIAGVYNVRVHDR